MKFSLAILSIFLHAPFISTFAAHTLSGRNHAHVRDILGNPVQPAVTSSTPPSLPTNASTVSTVQSSQPATLSSSGTSSQPSIPSQSGTSSAVTSVSSASATVSTTSGAPTQTIDPTTLNDISTVHERRLSTIIAAMASPDSIPDWLSSLGSDGKWPDSEVDYTTGCAARRANWPAQEHWQRILVMSGAWHGGLPDAEQFVKDPTLQDAISRAMDYWFGRDITNLACLDSGGTPACPCSNPDNSLWNTNWFSNIILIPELVGQSCLLVNDTLTASQLSNCSNINERAYGTFDHSINGVGFLTGANTLDVAKIGIDEALLTVNASQVSDAYRRVHLELSIRNSIKADGIRPDGSFGQHAGILYNGNYGKDYTNDLLDLEVEAGGTQFAANSTSQTAFATLFDGDRWMIFRNSLTGVLHWDFSVLGRFISFPVIDEQATGSIKINLTEVGELGQQWSSSTLINFASSLSGNTTNANAGNLVGNRVFYANDYMVQRGKNYVSTLKMFSSRTVNTECTNLQNPLGFHLSDGTLYTYIKGNEYEDISVAWDWNLIPGTTVDYGATPLNCAQTQFTGIEAFVGGVSDEAVGIAAMRYTNPLTKALHWQKAWFFLDDDIQHVMISNISSTSGSPVYSVLDQRLHSGSVVIDGTQRQTLVSASVESLWHGSVGYSFDSSDAFTVSVDVGEKSGNWSTIGTSTQPPATVDLFSARIEHQTLSAPVAYTAFPGTTMVSFETKKTQLQLQTIQNNGDISAVYDAKNKVAMAVFWDAAGGSITFTPDAKSAPITMAVNGNIAIIYKLNTGEVIASDPSQTLIAVQVTLTIGTGRKPAVWGQGLSKSLIFEFPSGGLAGSSVVQFIS